MKILIISREFPPHVLGGISYALSYLCDELSKNNDITVLAGNCEEASDRPIHQVSDDITIHSIPYGSVKGYHIRFPYHLWKFLQRFDIYDFDLAYTHTPIPFRLGIPMISHYHDSKREGRKFYREELTLLESILDRIIEPSRRVVDQRSLDIADYYIFNSDLCKNTWDKYYRFSSQSKVIYNGVNTNDFYPGAEQNDFLLFIGDQKRKGIDTVYRYAKRSDRRVILVGDPRVESRHIEIKKKVSQEQLRSLYSQAYATIHPANYEAFGNVILESLACGTPVVVSDKCGASEILTKSTGVVTNDLSWGINQVSRCDRESCRKLAETYSWNSVKRKFVDVANTII